jgi:proteasome lid subunit RPN8/RPN11
MSGAWRTARPEKIELSSAAADAVAQALSSTSTRECCGFLVGNQSGATIIVCSVIEARNAYEFPLAFGISPEEHQRCRLCCPPGEHIVGLYHTHLAHSWPSALDIRNMGLYPYVWLVLNHRDKSRTAWRCYVLQGESLREVQINLPNLPALVPKPIPAGINPTEVQP